jgi:hypothetical protein
MGASMKKPVLKKQRNEKELSSTSFILWILALTLSGWAWFASELSPQGFFRFGMTEEEREWTQNSLSANTASEVEEENEASPSEKNEIHTNALQDSIDNELKQGDHKMRMRSFRARQQQWETKEFLSQGHHEQPPGHRFDLSLSQESSVQNLHRMLKGSSDRNFVPSVDEYIEALVAEDQWINEYDESFKQEMVAEFKRRARAAGYEVEFNKDLEISVLRTILRRDQALRFPNDSGPTASDEMGGQSGGR